MEENKNTGSSEDKGQNKNKAVLIWVLVAMMVLAGGGFWYWTTTPEYSLQQIAAAYSRHDLAKFQKHVDLQSAVPRAIDQLADASIGGLDESRDPWARLAGNLAEGLVETFKPQAADILIDEIEAYVESGDMAAQDSSQIPGYSLNDLYLEYNLDSAQYTGIEYVKREGQIAIVGLNFNLPDYSTSLTVDVKMRDKGSYWQLAEISNFGSVFEKLEALKRQHR